MTRIRGLTGLAVFLIAVWTLASAAQEQRRIDSDDTYQDAPTPRLDVDLVLVNVTVTDQRNRTVSSLEQEHFRVWEHRIEQDIVGDR